MPTGVACDVETAGIFPSAGPKGASYKDIRRFWAQAEPLANYASVEEHEKLVRAEIGRLRERGFVTVYKTWADVIKRFGNVVVSKMAAVVKPREDGTTKLRLIIDMLRSHVNEHVRLHERIVLPRIVDIVRDSLSLLEGSSDGGDVDLMILDWEDAFHTMGVRAEELPHQIVKGFDGEYVEYETVLQDRRCSVLAKTRIQVYVDDPCTVWRGTPAVRSWNKVILLLWWLVVGPAISWKKLQIGRQVKWIGVQVQLEEKAVVITLPDKFIAELLVEVEQILLAAAVPTGRLRKLAGRAEWAASVVPYLKAMISPIWKALGDAQRSTVGRRRIAHSLRWLRAFLLRRRGTLQRSYHPDDGYAAADLVMEFDASPWGLGGVLYFQGKPQKWFSNPIHNLDVKRFTVEIGKAKGPGLVGGPCDVGRCSVVGKVLLHQEVGGVPAKRLTCRTWGSVQVAIAGPIINAVVREISLDLAEGKYEIDFLEHIPGANNVYADSLSRFYQPGASRKIPEDLAGAERDLPPKRTKEWWETVEVGGDQEDSEGTAEQSSEEVGQRWRGAFAGMPWNTKRRGPGHDVRVPSHFVRLAVQVENSFCTWWAPDCKTFSKARGRCRSVEFPLGLPILSGARRKADRDKVEAGNEIASFTFRLCSEAHKKGRSCAVENPRGSFMWDLPDARKLAAEVGVFKATFSLCMYEGGSRNKHVTVLTNSQALRDVLDGKLCKHGKTCDRTWDAHETWTPTVVSGEILNYPTEADEEYPEGSCEAVAMTIVGEYAEAITNGYVYRWGFTEVFSGPNAPLTCAAEHAAKEFFGQRCVGSAYC